MSEHPEIRHERVRANGLQFHVACSGSGDKLALCLHGFPESSYSWRHQLPLLARLGYRAWAPDLLGYGETDRPPKMQDYAIEKLLDDVTGLIDASDTRETLLLGHDWGAAIAWYYAMRKPRDLERLVIMNVPHPACFLRELRTWRQLSHSWYMLFFQIPWLPETVLGWGEAALVGKMFADTTINKERFGEDVQRVYRENAARPGALTAMIDYYRAMLRGGGAKRQRDLGHPTIEVPTLLLWGLHDIALSVETTYGTDDYVDDLTIRYLSDASHWVQQDDPDTVNAMLEAWLTGSEVPEEGE